MSCEYCDPERYHEEPCEKHGGTGECFKCWAYQQRSPLGESGCFVSEQRKLKHKFCFNCGFPLSDPTPLTLGELRGMDGEPVWVQSVMPMVSPFHPHWEVIEMVGDDRIYISGRGPREFRTYGKTWLAYTHKPKDTEVQNNG